MENENYEKLKLEIETRKLKQEIFINRNVQTLYIEKGLRQLDKETTK